MSIIMSRLGVARNGDHVSVEGVMINPQMAVRWLDMNSKNRRPSPGHVKHLEEVFRRGEMTLNGQTIKISKTGVLLDGQHRLMACVNTGIPFPCMVVTGLPDEVFDTIDTGSKPRNLSDIFGMNGETSSKMLATTVRILVIFRNTMGSFYDGGGGNPTIRDCESMIHRHPGIRDSVRELGGKGNFIWRVGHSMALHYLFSTVNPRMADEFSDVLLHGSPDTARPFNLFRESMVKAKSKKGRVDQRVETARAIKAFNFEVNGTRPKLIQWKNTEEFPRIAGLDLESL